MPPRGKTGAPAPARGTKLTVGFGLVNVDVKLAPLTRSRLRDAQPVLRRHDPREAVPAPGHERERLLVRA